jgi:hypothetical protein
MRYYYIVSAFVLLFALGWLFRKQLASHAAMLFFRILAVLGTLTGVITWTIISLGLWHSRNYFSGWGDNAETSNTNFTWPWVLLFWTIYSLPEIAFVLMLFSSLKLFKGKMRSIVYWYALVVLIIMAGFFWWIDSEFHFWLWKQVGFTFFGFAIFWGYCFRKNSSQNWEATAPK